MCSRYNWPRWILAPSPSIKDARELKYHAPQPLHFKDAWELKQKNIKAGVPRRNGPTGCKPQPLHIKDAWELKQNNIKAGVPRA